MKNNVSLLAGNDMRAAFSTPAVHENLHQSCLTFASYGRLLTGGLATEKNDAKIHILRLKILHNQRTLLPGGETNQMMQSEEF